VYDHTSVLKLIEKRWSLPPLAVRDANALSLGTALDFEQRPRTAAPEYAVAPILAGVACPAGGPLTMSTIASAGMRPHTDEDEWGGLYDLARASGWSV
jgi:hypothetical protein